jgi:hypothetical protein
MINSNYNPSSIDSFEKTKVTANNQGAKGLALAGQSTNIDLALTDDHLLTGVNLIAKGSAFGDTVSLQIVDALGTLPNGLSFPVGTILNQFATVLNVPDDIQEKFNEDSGYPAKLYAGLTIRLIYTSVGTSDVQVAINYKLHKVLI